MATANSINANSTGIAVYDGSGTWTGRTITAGAGVTVTNGSGVSGNPTIAVATGGLTWVDAASATQAMSVQTGYFTDRGAGVTYTLPTTAAAGDVIIVDGKLGLSTVNYTTNQQILIGSVSSTVTSGTIVGTNVGDCITLRCITANLVFRAESLVGNWTVT